MPPGDDHCIEKYVCSEFKDCMQESSDVEVRESFSSRIWKSLSVDCRAAMEELQAGRGPLAHERKGKITCYRTELCQFARQLSQAKNRSCRRRCLTKFLQVHQVSISHIVFHLFKQLRCPGSTSILPYIVECLNISMCHTTFLKCIHCIPWNRGIFYWKFQQSLYMYIIQYKTTFLTLIVYS